MIEVERCLTGRLHTAYPVGAHDVELRITGTAPDELPTLLRNEAQRVIRSDPRCRKVLFAPRRDDKAAIEAARVAGFRHVVDVDVPVPGSQLIEELALLVIEPTSVTKVDRDIDRVPGS